MQEVHNSHPPSFSSTMTDYGHSNPTHVHRNPAHHRDTSDELDVFEASRYFSGNSESMDHFSMNFISTYDDESRWKNLMRSLDFPLENQPPLEALVVEEESKRKPRKPMSPGSFRLASLLNSLFNQTATKKKKKKSTHANPNSSVKHVVEENSQLWITTRSSSMRSLSHEPGRASFARGSYSDWLWESDLVFCCDGSVGNKWVLNKNCDQGLLKVGGLGFEEYIPKRRFWRRGEVEDGDESDSSSDLFELPSYRMWDFKEEN